MHTHLQPEPISTDEAKIMATPVAPECPQCRSHAVVRALSVEGYGYCVSCGWVFPTTYSPHEPHREAAPNRCLPQIDPSLLARG